MLRENENPGDDGPGPILILVHPGSFFTSARAQVPEEVFDQANAGLEACIRDCGGLIVIDNSFFDGVPSALERLVLEKLTVLSEFGLPALKVWGCDDAIRPPPSWRGFSSEGDLIGSCQEEAAQIAIWHLDTDPQSRILCAGAWATHDGASGCVSSVLQRIKSLGFQDASLCREACIFEEDISIEPDEAVGPHP